LTCSLAEAGVDSVVHRRVKTLYTH